IAVAVADADLVKGDLRELAQTRLLEAALQVAFDDVLDGVPADAEVTGHVLDGHQPAQLQGVPLEGLGVAAPGVGKGQAHRADDPASPAFDAGDGQDDGDGLVADGNGFEGAGFVAVVDDIAGVALRATAGVRALLNREHDTALSVVGLDVVIAAQTEGVVQ